jgi:hypothetical protein
VRKPNVRQVPCHANAFSSQESETATLKYATRHFGRGLFHARVSDSHDAYIMTLVVVCLTYAVFERFVLLTNASLPSGLPSCDSGYLVGVGLSISLSAWVLIALILYPIKTGLVMYHVIHHLRKLEASALSYRKQLVQCA